MSQNHYIQGMRFSGNRHCSDVLSSAEFCWIRMPSVSHKSKGSLILQFLLTYDGHSNVAWCQIRMSPVTAGHKPTPAVVPVRNSQPNTVHNARGLVSTISTQKYSHHPIEIVTDLWAYWDEVRFPTRSGNHLRTRRPCTNLLRPGLPIFGQFEYLTHVRRSEA